MVLGRCHTCGRVSLSTVLCYAAFHFTLTFYMSDYLPLLTYMWHETTPHPVLLLFILLFQTIRSRLVFGSHPILCRAYPAPGMQNHDRWFAIRIREKVTNISTGFNTVMTSKNLKMGKVKFVLQWIFWKKNIYFFCLLQGCPTFWPSGGLHWKKRKCLGPHIKHTKTTRIANEQKKSGRSQVNDPWQR